MTAPTANASPGSFALAIHGGAGTLRRDAMSAARADRYHAGLRQALEAGHDVLPSGGSALDAGTAAGIALGGGQPFKAGRGAVFTAAGTPEMGAGTWGGDGRGGARGDRYHAGLRQALEGGQDVLASGGSALDAVTAAVIALEDEQLLNAGRGAVFTAAGTQEMDAAVMDGRERQAGAGAGIFGPKKPGPAAPAGVGKFPQVFLIGDRAPPL